ncbi:MAG: fatty acid desaturase [Bdellovibrionota bacterium]
MKLDLLSCALLFFATYCLNLFYITVLYHRGLTHRALRLTPGTAWLLKTTGNWVTGLDPKAWACMHRLHHLYSDTPLDPHSPLNDGVLGVAKAQLGAYESVLRKLKNPNSAESKIVGDLDFPIHWLNEMKLWFLPYLLHAAVAALIAIFSQRWYLGMAYWLGMMSHPFQGWMVNALAHRYGYRNFPTADNSRNNTAVAWLVMGEGFQNNHHQNPGSPKFSVRWWELDLGYGMCRVAEGLGLLKIP